MPKEHSPFTPGQPVPVEFFVGRLQQVERLKSDTVAVTKPALRVVFLSGERGIGRSSLASFVRSISERDHKVLGLHTFLGGVSTLEEMARRVFDRLLKESSGETWEGKVKKFFGNHIRHVGLFGVSLEFSAPEKDLRRMVADFAPALSNLLRSLEDEKKGLLLILDDINGLASSVDFANWLKSLVDEIATMRPPLALCLVLVGLEERRQELVRLQPSLARVFDLIEISTWSREESEMFFETAFSKVALAVDKDGLDVLCRFAGGLPVLAHEVGEAAFKVDDDGRIDREDAFQGVIAAADVVGRKHLEPQVFEAIRSVRYRAILREIAKEPFEIVFTRADISSRLKEEQRKVLDNFLQRMKRLGVIRSDREGGRGAYQFANQLHYLYFWLEAQRARETRDA